MKTEVRIQYILDWIKQYCNTIKYQPVTLVIGVSGGVDSAVTSTLSAKTGLKTIAVSMPIKQNHKQHDLSIKHLDWLKSNFENVITREISLDSIFFSFEESMQDFKNNLAFANSRSRLRMTTLYQIAQSNNGLVVGTGNKVEDFGVGFYTKYGDGGVDISPIADCTKTQVWEIASKMSIIEDIIEAQPTDGLWDDGRNDERQLGLTYKQIEEAMDNKDSKYYEKYMQIRKLNLHKMKPIPICLFEDD
ncbi:MAG: NAD(+) synthase [Pelagibacteraceae bacterium]|jgi:NAD+ synthase|nr:NAD(+) synthase [Pelagibacteraceae bacterium]MDP6784664.1 NAD(+) synthase [Alphaproteobacteria bacterium]MBO6466928.1 NAD(+) synthase [Pelagibacteraceae bacterium]MBO6467450.1 NAD(+) synthase [Pelagibacteraceae bacterium]MBO6470518.1 NAD(+) synthase [Pelagibacteraceae bacterium]|tara:strand:- start:86 stop:826 length:741 start_codon:yes stop_codon:yes gene_type:complete